MILLFVLLYGVLAWLLPWWFVVLVGFAFGAMEATTLRAVTTGFCGGFFSWLLVMTFFDFPNRLQAAKVLASVFSVPDPWLMLLLAALTGGFLAVVGAGLGRLWRLNLE